MNREFDKFSLPKQSARQLIEMHKGRGDRIVFVTARPQTPDEGLSAVLARTFGLTNPEVVFVGKAGKTDALRRLGVVLYYGDSDSDIIEAREAGCRTVRVLRPAMSTYTGAANPGTFGEDVLESSDR
jgi:acid phosphatase (class B)